MTANETWLTAAEASEKYSICKWDFIKVVRRVGTKTRYCRKKWSKLYEDSIELAEAIKNYTPLQKKTGKHYHEEHPVNLALNQIIAAFNGTEV